MKRQRGRNRKPSGGGGGGGQNPNRAFESNGPDGVKIRGAAQHVYERYHQLARDNFASGDRVLAENYLQHAEHYFRVLRTLQPQRSVSEIAARDAFASGFDIDFEDDTGGEGEGEGGAPEAAEEGGEPQFYAREGREGGEFRRDREFRGERRDGGEPRREGGEQRREGGEQRRVGGEQRREGGEQRREGGEQRREGGEQRREGGEQRREGGEQRAEGGEQRAEGEGGRRESRRERFERRREERRLRGPLDGAEADAGDPMPVVEPQATPQTSPLAAAAEGEGSPMLRAQDGAESQMPAFLRQAVPAAATAPEGEPQAEPVERPRRTRRRRPDTFEAAEGEAAPVAPAEEQA